MRDFPPETLGRTGDISDPQMGELVWGHPGSGTASSPKPAVDYWKGEAGDAYIERNELTAEMLTARMHLWAEILQYVKPWPISILEVGANIGINLRAMQKLLPSRPPFGEREYYAVEPNDAARWRLEEDGIVPSTNAHADDATFISFPDGFADLVFTSGVLIHIPMSELRIACSEIHRCSRKWIVAIEYFSADLRMVPYRGEDDRLWARDFGAFYLDNFPDLEPVACGFAWKRLTGLDNLTYWILRKS